MGPRGGMATACDGAHVGHQLCQPTGTRFGRGYHLAETPTFTPKAFGVYTLVIVL